jgi:hypothetical protein
LYLFRDSHPLESQCGNWLLFQPIAESLKGANVGPIGIATVEDRLGRILHRELRAAGGRSSRENRYQIDRLIQTRRNSRSAISIVHVAAIIVYHHARLDAIVILDVF